VESTKSFPESGHLVVSFGPAHVEIVFYGRKDGCHFMDCQRGTAPVVSSDTIFDSSKNGTKPLPLPRGACVTAYGGLHLSPGVKREPDVYVQVVRPPQHPRLVRAGRENDAAIITWQPARNCREVRNYEIWRKTEDKEWTNIGSAPVGTHDFRESDAPQGWALYAIKSVEYSGLTSALSVEALIAPMQGTAFPREIYLSAGDAQIGNDPGRKRVEVIDSGAYNEFAVAQANGGAPLCWTFEMPMALSCEIWIHCRTTSGYAAMIRVACNEETFVRPVDSSAYSWVSAVTDNEGRPMTVDLKAGENVVELATRGESLVVDRIRLDLKSTAR